MALLKYLTNKRLTFNVCFLHFLNREIPYPQTPSGHTFVRGQRKKKLREINGNDRSTNSLVISVFSSKWTIKWLGKV